VIKYKKNGPSGENRRKHENKLSFGTGVRTSRHMAIKIKREANVCYFSMKINSRGR
jgi:hypothetical protein